jgi:hypothetical protein
MLSQKKVDFPNPQTAKSRMSNPIIQPASFVVSKVSVTQPKLLDSGAKFAYLNYSDARSLVIQTPQLPTPFGLKVFDKEGPPKYSVELALRGYNGATVNPKVKSLYDALSALDEHMIDLGVKNSKLWFKAELKREVVQAFYTPTVKFGRDKDGNQTPYPPNVKLQLRRTSDGSGFETEFYGEDAKTDRDAKPIKDVPAEELLVNKAEITALMQCTGVWFSGGSKFGLSWKAVQIRMDSVPSGVRRGASAFVNDEDAVQPQDDEEVAPAPSALQRAPTVAPTEDQSDDEEVAPAPVPKKKVVTMKKATAPK